jgi:hypothetical protein
MSPRGPWGGDSTCWPCSSAHSLYPRQARSWSNRALKKRSTTYIVSTIPPASPIRIATKGCREVRWVAAQLEPQSPTQIAATIVQTAMLSPGVETGGVDAAPCFVGADVGFGVFPAPGLAAAGPGAGAAILPD